MNSSLIDQIEIRTWVPDDFEKAVVLNRESEIVLNIPSETGDWAQDMVGIVETFLETGGEFLVGYIDEELILMGGFKPIAPSKAEVKRMRIDPKFQRQGLGIWLLRELEHRMKGKGFKDIQISTLAAQTGAIGLYQSANYKEVGRSRKAEIENGLEVVTFAKSLAD